MLARVLFAVLGLLVERWCLRSETGNDPWIGIHCRSYTSLRHSGETGVGMPSSSHAQSAQLLFLGVSFILDLSLSWTVGKYRLVAVALWLVVHSRCHFCLASSSASWYRVLFEILALAASFANLSAISLPCVPASALTEENFILYSLLSRLATFFIIDPSLI